MSRPVLNLHNHTPFSDGAYTIDEICEAHLDLKGIRVDGIGICDHLFCTPSSRAITSEREFERVFADETRRYVEMVREARTRWAGRMQIYCGAEINWPLNRTMLDVIRRMLDGIDFVLVEFANWAGLTQMANQSRRWPCPVGLAHTDVGVQFPNTSMDQVVRTLANARIFYEINSKLLPLTTHQAWFNLLPKHRVPVTVGTDLHDDLSVLRDVPVIYDFIDRNNLADRLLVPAIREGATVSA